MKTQHLLACLLFTSVICYQRVSGTITGNVSCYDRPTVYADGLKIGENTDGRWWSGQVDEDTKLLAIKCTNNGGSAGLLVSVNDVLISDSTWKCTKDEVDNWYALDFDDSLWNPAYELGRNGATNNESRILDSAQWIWTDEGNQAGTSYCRGRTGMVLHARCNDICDIYADGQQIGDILSSYYGVWSATIPKTSRLIAVEARNTRGNWGAIIVGTSVGFKSSLQWKCSRQNEEGWTAIDYNDDSWGPAVLQKNSGVIDIKVEDVFNGAIPIWHTLSPTSYQWCRCRGDLECGCEYKCHVDEDTFNCVCEDGYTLRDDHRTCRDVNECIEPDTPQHECEQVCTNQPGTYECHCEEGFTLDDDGRHCTDINECTDGTDDCLERYGCHNTIGSFQCICPSGYTLDGDNCNNIDECLTTTAGCSQGCQDVPGSYTCFCWGGYLPETPDNKTCDDIDECNTGEPSCSGSFMCKNTVGSFACVSECSPGYTTSSDGSSCVDADECDTDNGGCSHICNNTIGSFKCSAPLQEGKQTEYNFPVPETVGALAAVILLLLIAVTVLASGLVLKRRRTVSNKPGLDSTGHPRKTSQPRIDAEVEATGESAYQEIREQSATLGQQQAAGSSEYEMVDHDLKTEYEGLPERTEYVNQHVSPYEDLHTASR